MRIGEDDLVSPFFLGSFVFFALDAKILTFFLTFPFSYAKIFAYFRKR